MNRKGFMMAELVVVAAIVLTTMVGLYTSYNKVHSIYQTRLSYHDVTTLYRLGYYRDVLKESKEKNINTIKDSLNNDNKIVEVYNSISKDDSNDYIPSADKIDNAADRVFMVYNNKNKQLDKEIFKAPGLNLHVTFLEYIEFLSNSVNLSNFDYIMVMERCSMENNILDEDNCSYAYLEIYDTIFNN